MIKFKGSANGVMDQKYNDLKEFNEHVHNIRNGKKMKILVSQCIFLDTVP